VENVVAYSQAGFPLQRMAHIRVSCSTLASPRYRADAFLPPPPKLCTPESVRSLHMNNFLPSFHHSCYTPTYWRTCLSCLTHPA
jgi:hypothetical protein